MLSYSFKHLRIKFSSQISEWQKIYDSVVSGWWEVTAFVWASYHLILWCCRNHKMSHCQRIGVILSTFNIYCCYVVSDLTRLSLSEVWTIVHILCYIGCTSNTRLCYSKIRTQIYRATSIWPGQGIWWLSQLCPTDLCAIPWCWPYGFPPEICRRPSKGMIVIH